MVQFILILITGIFFLVAYSGNNKKIAKAFPPKESWEYFCEFAYTEEEAPECFESKDKKPARIAEASPPKESLGYFCEFAYTEEEAPECF